MLWRATGDAGDFRLTFAFGISSWPKTALALVFSLVHPHDLYKPVPLYKPAWAVAYGLGTPGLHICPAHTSPQPRPEAGHSESG